MARKQTPMAEYSAPELYAEMDLEDADGPSSEEVDDYGLTESDRQELIKRAAKAAADAHAYWDEIYDEMETDWKMFKGGLDQWTEGAKAVRKNRPMLSLNHLPKFVHQGVAETRRNPPSIKLSPRENGDLKKAELGMGLVRYIEDAGGSKYAYSNAIQGAMVGGLGWWKGSFQGTKIITKLVRDALSIMIDPEAEEIDGSDANWFISHSKKKINKKLEDCYEYWWKEEVEGGEEGQYNVFWAVIEGSEIEDYGQFPGSIIPIFPVFGEIIEIRGKKTLKGVIRDLIDVQRNYNYTRSQEVETVALTPKAPIIAAEGSIANEAAWKRATKTPVDILYYVPNDSKGPLPAPTFAQTRPDISWAAQLTAGAISDFREISGIYDTSLGQDSREISGKAIIAKQQTSDSIQYTYSEHLMATMQHFGRWIIGMIKPVMGEMQVIRILGEDGKQQTVDLLNPKIDPNTGLPEIIDLDFSEMDLSVGSAPAYATRREAAATAMQDLMTSIPASANLIADLAVKNLDLPGMDEAARRLYAVLPPELKQEEGGQPAMVPQAIVDQIVTQSQQAIQNAEAKAAAKESALMQQLTALQAELDKQTSLGLAREQMQSQTEIAVAQIKEEGANKRKAADIAAKAQDTNKKIAADTIQAQRKSQAEVVKASVAAQAPQAPNTVSISNTKIEQPKAPTLAVESPFVPKFMPGINPRNLGRLK